MFSTVTEAIEEIRAGRMVVLVDDEERENEGDIIFAAQAATPEKINFILSHARGVICTPISREIAEHFELPLMVANNSSNHETPFTITIDAASALTGVSTQERCDTILQLVAPNASAKDFVRPGHINPLIAKDGGVLERTGHTEGTVDLCALAGFERAGVLCEILNDDGTMARRDDLAAYCERWGLKMISIEQLINYRLQSETLVSEKARTNYKIAEFDCTRVEFCDFKGAQHFAYIFSGAKSKSAASSDEARLVKFLKSTNHGAFIDEFISAYAAIKRLHEEGGALICLNAAKSDAKSYGIGAQVLKALGFARICLLSEGCAKDEFAAVAGFGIQINCEIKL